jgi:hypothetical protein
MAMTSFSARSLSGEKLAKEDAAAFNAALKESKIPAIRLP